MKIAVSMCHEHSYEELKKRLSEFEGFQFSQPGLFTLYPCHGDYRDLVERITHGEMGLVIVDEQLPYFEKAEALCRQLNVEIIRFQGDFASILTEVDMAASFFTDEMLGKARAPNPENEESPHRQKEIVVKIGEKVVEREIEKLRYAHIPPKILVFGSLWSGAGSTLYCMNLARAVAERNVDVSYLEFPMMKPYMFDYLNVSRLEKESGVPYTDYARKISQLSNTPKIKGYRYKGVQWVINDSRYPLVSQWSSEDMLKLVYSLRDTPIIIVDVSTCWNAPGLKDFLQHVDHIYVCVEPDPVKIDWTSTINDTVSGLEESCSVKLLTEIEKSGNSDYDYIETKMNRNIPINSWHECLDRPPVSSIPAIPYEDISLSAWESKFLYDHPRHHETFENSFLPIIRSLLPKDYLNLNGRKSSGFIKKWFKRGHAQ